MFAFHNMIINHQHEQEDSISVEEIGYGVRSSKQTRRTQKLECQDIDY